jgi:hypothetical protein
MTISISALGVMMHFGKDSTYGTRHNWRPAGSHILRIMRKVLGRLFGEG